MCNRLAAIQKCNLVPNGVVAGWIAGAILSVWLMEMQYVKGWLQFRNVILCLKVW